MCEYTPPQLTIVGSVNDLTQAITVSLLSDNLTGLPVGGETGDPGPVTS